MRTSSTERTGSTHFLVRKTVWEQLWEVVTMETANCTTCKIEKPKTIEFFYFRNDTNNFRKNCKVCTNDRKRKTKPAGKHWYYADVKQLFAKNGLTPTFSEFEGRVNAKEKLPALNEDGYKVWICVDKLRVGRIPDSFSKFNPWTVENIKTFLKKNEQDYNLLSNVYNNSQGKLKWKCDVGHIFYMNWADFQSGKRCARCSKVYKRTHEEFLEEIANLVGNEYTFLEKYKHVDKKLKVIHNVCGNEYEVTPYKFISAEQRCPKCQESKGEKKIRSYLIKNNINYAEEYTFEDCKHILPLRFDFAILDKKDNVVSLIEYDGKQHFKPYDFYGGEEKYKLTKLRDSIKNGYCEENNIKLLRIPYTKYENIEEILATHL